MHPAAMDTNYFTVICPFGGGGGGALGFQNATRTFRGVKGGFKLLGGFDDWPYAADVFKYLTGVEEVVLDARKMTGADYVRLYGKTAPRVVFTSPPCVAATKLVTNKKASTPKYVEMNHLLLTNTLTMFEAWPDGPDFVLVENVPNIVTKERGAEMLQQWCDLMRSRRYAIHVGTHNARHIGNLGQNRERLLIIARHQDKVPVFLYKPPRTPGRTLGDVVGPLPLPDDPAGGSMHGMTRGMSFRNRLRLFWIEAGKDWRSLIHDGLPERARFRRHLVSDPKEPCATIGGPGSNGPCAVADDQAPRRMGVDLAPVRGRFPGSLGVQDPAQPASAVIGEAAPSNGANALADGRVPVGLGLGADNPGRHENKFAIVPWNGVARTVCGIDTRVGSGAPACADPRVVDLALSSRRFQGGAGPGRWGVIPENGIASTVTANARESTGPFAIADSRPVPVDLVPRAKCYDHGYGVLAACGVSPTVAGGSWVGCGAYAIAGSVPPPEGPPCRSTPDSRRAVGTLVLDERTDACEGSGRVPVDLALRCAPHAGSYGVAAFCEPSKCVIAHAKIDNSTSSVADPRPVPRYVVLTYAQTRAIVEGTITVPFAIVDPSDPEHPLAIVDDLDKPAYRIETRTTKRGKLEARRVSVPVWMISADGTCHRELTTVELACLQGFPAQHRGKPLDFGGGSNKQRKVIGNAVPPPVAEAIAEQMLISLIASTMCAFMLTPSDWDLWVKGLEDEGFVVVPSDAMFDFARGVALDDGASRPRRKRAKKSTARRRLEALVAMSKAAPRRAPAAVEAWADAQP